MPSNRWPAKNELSGSFFGDSLSQNVLANQVYYRPFAYTLWFYVLGFHGISVCVREHLSLYMCVSCAFPLATFTYFVC